MPDRPSPPRPLNRPPRPPHLLLGLAPAALAFLLAAPAALPAATPARIVEDPSWPPPGAGRQVSPDATCPLDLAPQAPGVYLRQITGDGWRVDACGILHRTTGTTTGSLPDAARGIAPWVASTSETNATIDSIRTWNLYFDQYSPFQGIQTLGMATTYYLSDGRSWPSGAGSARLTRARLLSSETFGDSVRFVLIPPPDSVLYQQTDFSFGDHSSQGTLTVAGPMVIVARVGDTDAEMDGLAYVHDNDITSYGEPAFNYFSAVVGSVVRYRVRYHLSSGTWGAATLDGSFQYSLTGLIDFSHPVSTPKVQSLLVTGPSQVPDRSTAQFGAVAAFEGGTTRDVTSLATWSVTPSSFASVNAGQLVTQAIPRDTLTLVLHASYTRDGVTKEGERPVLCRRDLFAAGVNAWPTFQADERHDGYVPVTLHVADFKPAWSVTLRSDMALNPVSAAEGHVFCSVISYFGNGDMFFALDARDGHTMWSKTSTSFSVNPPAAAYGNVYFQTCNNAGDTWLYGFDGATGNAVFKSPFGAQWERYYAPTPYRGRLYIDGGQFGGMYAFDALSGQQFWYLGLPQYDQWTPAVDSSYVYAYVGEYNPGLYVAHRDDAAQAFMIPDPSFNWDGWSMFGAAVLGTQGDVLAHHDGRLIRFDLANRSISWQIPNGFLDQPSVAKGSIYVVRDGALDVLDERTGSLQWSWAAPAKLKLTGAVIVTDSHVFTTGGDSVFAVDLATHQRAWAYQSWGALALGNGQLYIAHANGQLDAVTVVAPPVPLVRADAGPDTTVDCTGRDARGVAVRLDGRRSRGSPPLTFSWSAPGVTFDDPTSPTPTGWFPSGWTDVALTVTSADGQASDTVRVTVLDNTPPELRVEMSPATLWPPDRRLVPVHTNLVATDDCDPSPHWTLVSVSERDIGAGPQVPGPNQDIQDVALGTPDADVTLRADRPGDGEGRLYSLCFEAIDATGNTTRACGTVMVPHDRSGRAALSIRQAGGTKTLTLYGSTPGDLAALDPASVAVYAGDIALWVPASGEPVISDVDGDGVPDATLLMRSTSSTAGSDGAMWVRWKAGSRTELAALSSGSALAARATPVAFTASVSPNPGQTRTVLRYALPRAGHVRVRVFDAAGRLVTTKVDADREPGQYDVPLAGIGDGHVRLYFYSIEWQGERRTGKFIVMD